MLTLVHDDVLFDRYRREFNGLIESTVRFNLPLPDVAAEELAIWLQVVIDGEIDLELDGTSYRVRLGFSEAHSPSQILVGAAPKSGSEPPLDVDPSRFDRHQSNLISAIAESISTLCRHAGMSDAELEQHVTEATFSVAAALDGIEAAPQRRPRLMFVAADPALRLIASETGSFMHEYASGAAALALRGDGGKEAGVDRT